MNHPPSPDMTHIAGNVYANEAGLRWLEVHRQKPVDPHASVRCYWADFQCPFARRGEGFPCITPKRHAKLLVRIGTWNWRPEKRPIGQMSLFEPHRTHKIVWVNTRTGRETDTYPHPAFVMVSCKDMAVAHTRWLETREGWHPDAWRIIPLTDTKSDVQWKEEQIKQHGLKPCVFDEF